MQEYFILDISPGHHSIYGDTILVTANPIVNTGLRKSVTLHPYEDSVYFILPKRFELIQELVAIARAEKPWVPFMADFSNEYMNINGQSHHLVYLHMSFINDIFDSD